MAFLRAPFNVGPVTGLPWWPPPEPRAEAATPTVPLPIKPSTPTPAPVATAPLVFAPLPYRYYGPSDAQLHTVSVDSRALGRLVEERLTMLEGFGDRAAGRDVLFLIGAEHQAVGDFARAADFYEAFLTDVEVCEQGRQCDAAATSLENAMVFRRALGDREAAIADADTFESRFVLTHPRAATRVSLAAADIADDRVARLERLRTRRLPPAEMIQVEVRLGKTLWSENRPAARAAFRRAERTWSRSGGPQMAISPGLDATTWIAELGRTREALADARLHEARRHYRNAEAMNAPAYKGEAREARVARWVERRLRPWMARRLRAIRRAERALDAVDELGLSRATVPAASLRGSLYQDLADALEALDVPNAVVPENDESIGAVVQYREPVHRHLVVPAMEHFRACMELARETRGYGEASDRCADGLARYEPRWRRPEELRPRRWLDTIPSPEPTLRADF